MSKTATRKAKQAEYLAEMLERTARPRRSAELQKYEPPPYKHGFIVKPTNPGWITALERKVRQYKQRADDDETRYRLLLLNAILRDGEVNLEAARKEAMSQGIRLGWLDSYHKTEQIMHIYCYRGGEGVTSFGGFLPSDPNYDDTI